MATQPDPHQMKALEQQYRLGNFPVVLEACDRLLQQFPDSAALYNAKGMTLLGLLQPERAIEAFDKTLKLAPDNAEAYLNLALAHDALGHTGNALNACNKAIQLEPGNAKAHNNRGAVLHQMGPPYDARKSYSRATVLDPRYANAHRHLSQLKTYQPGDRQIAVMEQLLADETLNDSDRCHLGFALGKAYDDLADYERAFERLAVANRLRKEELQYRLTPEIGLMAEIRARFETLEPERIEPPGAQPDDIQPVFIVGMIRSGTTLVEQILASHSAVYGAGELAAADQSMADIEWRQSAAGGDAWKRLCSRLRQGYLARLKRLKRREKIVIDKMPANFRWLGFLLCAFVLPACSKIMAWQAAR